MSPPQVPSLSLLALAILAGCNSLPANNAAIDKARSDVKLTQDSAQARELAPDELQRAGDALAKANESRAVIRRRRPITWPTWQASVRPSLRR